jgi:hypothetical protein
MGIWGGFLRGDPPQPPTRQLMLPRLMNMLVNPFISQSDGNGDAGGAVYSRNPPGPPHSIIPLSDPVMPPQWPMVEFVALGALKTGRTRMLLPENFMLLNYFASASVNTKGGFRITALYDVNRRMPLNIRPVNFQTLAGQGNAQLFLRVPYPFGPSVNNSPPQVKITLVNLESAPNTIQFGLYGVVGAKCGGGC